MVAIGYGIATFLIYKNAGHYGLDKNKMIDLTIFTLIGGLVGARLLYVTLNVDYYFANPIEVFYLSRGGLVWYGGFFAGLAASIFYIWKKGLPLWPILDLIVPYLALAQAVGRIGCYLNGCCFGIPGQPVQLYSSFALVLIFVMLKVWQDKKHFGGEVFAGYCLLYSLKRFFMEFLRGDNPRVILGYTFSQAISLAIFIIALIILFYKAAGWKKRV